MDRELVHFINTNLFKILRMVVLSTQYKDYNLKFSLNREWTFRLSPSIQTIIQIKESSKVLNYIGYQNKDTSYQFLGVLPQIKGEIYIYDDQETGGYKLILEIPYYKSIYQEKTNIDIIGNIIIELINWLDSDTVEKETSELKDKLYKIDEIDKTIKWRKDKESNRSYHEMKQLLQSLDYNNLLKRGKGLAMSLDLYYDSDYEYFDDMF
jgi:hypothetical protein